MKAIKYFSWIIFSVGCLALNGCGDKTIEPDNTSGAIAIQIPQSFPYNVTQTVTVNLSRTEGSNLNFSNLQLHTNPGSSIQYLTISPTSTCTTEVQGNAWVPSCTFTVTNNNNSVGENLLDTAQFTVTGTFNGQTVTSNVAYPNEQPPGTDTYWNMTIDNVSSSPIYVFVMGQNLLASGQPYGVITFNDSNYGTFHTYSASTNYGSNEDSITLEPGNNNIHIPYGVYAGRVYISTAQMQDLELTSNGGITLPDPGKSDDPNYNTIYDSVEFTYAADVVTHVSHAVINQTAVDFVSTPICLTGSSNYQPIQQAGFCDVANRNDLLSSVSTAFAAISDPTLRAQWESLILTDGPTTLRIMSPGSSDALSPPSPSTIDSFADYLDQYATELATEYSAADSLKVVSPDGLQVLEGNIQGGSYVFTNSGPGGNGSMPITTANLLVGAPPGGANAGVTAAYQMVSAAFMAGQLPPTAAIPTEGITQDYLRDHSATFYTSNTISDPADYLYSVYSNALNAIQSDGIYTYAYDDVLGKSSTMTETLSSATEAPDPITIEVKYN